jgi:hypothetical protein
MTVAQLVDRLRLMPANAEVVLLTESIAVPVKWAVVDVELTSRLSEQGKFEIVLTGGD